MLRPLLNAVYRVVETVVGDVVDSDEWFSENDPWKQEPPVEENGRERRKRSPEERDALQALMRSFG